MTEDADVVRAPAGGERADPSAVAYALGAIADNERASRKAETFLDNQAALAERQAALCELQSEELRRELRLHHWSARIHHLSAILKLAFEVAVAFVVLLLAALIAAAVWGASQDHGVVVQAFEIPRDFADRGVRGQAIAGDLLADLATMQEETDSARPANTYQNNWGDDFKVQIPDSGLTLGEVDQYLHDWLGHQTRISGELSRTPGGIAITARVGDARETFSGKESERDALLQKAAEAVYSRTQPYRYGAWLIARGRLDAAEAQFRNLAQDASAREREWAYVGLNNVFALRGQSRDGLTWTNAALALDPDQPLALWDAVIADRWLGRDEDLLAKSSRELRVLQLGNDDITDRARAQLVHQVIQLRASEMGDFGAALADSRRAETLPDYFNFDEQSRAREIQSLGFLHDGSGMRTRLRTLPRPAGDKDAFLRSLDVARALFALGDWARAMPAFRQLGTVAARRGLMSTSGLPVLEWPMQAVVEYERGNRAGAHALIAKTPLDCMVCAIMRGRIDELDGRTAAAAFWFADAARQAPSIPHPLVYWGAMLLHTGDYDGAIAKFASAHAKGPHFADPLEMWGEALIQKNRADLALVKFEEANNYAPNWGRLHLEWGKSLMWSGDTAGARKQFVIASHLELSAADKTSLSKWIGRDG